MEKLYTSKTFSKMAGGKMHTRVMTKKVFLEFQNS